MLYFFLYPGYVYNPIKARRAKKEQKIKSEQKRKQSLGVKSESVSGSSSAQQELLPTDFLIQEIQETSSTSTETKEATGQLPVYNYNPYEFM